MLERVSGTVLSNGAVYKGKGSREDSFIFLISDTEISETLPFIILDTLMVQYIFEKTEYAMFCSIIVIFNLVH